VFTVGRNDAGFGKYRVGPNVRGPKSVETGVMAIVIGNNWNEFVVWLRCRVRVSVMVRVRVIIMPDMAFEMEEFGEAVASLLEYFYKNG